jgi:hypothetical protein
LELRQPLHHRDHCPIAPGVLRKPSKLLKVNNTFTKVILKVKHKYRTPIAQNASIFKVSKDLTRWLVAIYYVYDWQTRLSLEIPPSPKRNGKKKKKKRKRKKRDRSKLCPMTYKSNCTTSMTES